MEEIQLFEQLHKEHNQDSFIKNINTTYHEIMFQNGSEILFRSCDKDRNFASMNLSGFAIDEPVDVSESVFLMLQSRLSNKSTKHHLGILATNPGGFDSWVYKYFFERKLPGYYTVETSTYDNVLLPQQEQYITDCENSFDADYARRYLQGCWGSFEGLIYKDFSKEKHVGDYRQSPLSSHIAGYDDGYRNPACLLIGGVDSDNRLYVLHEFYKSDFTTDEISNTIKPLYTQYDLRKIFCDPSGLNAIETFKRNGMRAIDADNKKQGQLGGISKLKSLFKQDMIYIDSSCVNLIKQLQSYRYEKDKASGNYTEEPVKKDDHAVDALRYMVSEYDPFKRFTLGVAFDWT
jgi:phage terminase large subunit